MKMAPGCAISSWATTTGSTNCPRRSGSHNWNGFRSWRQDALAENYREVARLGKEFYERLTTFADRFDEIRKRLDGAVQAYNEAAGSLEARVLVSARRLRDLKVTTEEELAPPGVIDTVPRVLKQVGLMGLPEGATTEDPELT